MPIDPDFLQPGGALGSPVLQRALDKLGAPPRELPAGTRVGPYRIVEELGRGGMAVVYLAERADGEFDQSVALKLVRPDYDSALAQELLRQERQILAKLEHPRIARLLDGGRSDDGSLWFALELVKGTRIDRYCRERQLSLSERLRLFAQVCEAVQFAHGRLLVHRDIKPSNILVAHDDSVKLLDFGIAQLLAPGADPALAARALTPGYASPEQQRGEPVTTASDIYQLGVLLQCMLEVTAINQDQDATATATASTRLSPQDETVKVHSDLRLSRDLVAIIAKAMQAQPADRYTTAAELKTDIDNFLDQRPVTARAGGAAYRAWCYTRRHRWVLAASTGALAAFIATVTHFTLRVGAERDQAHIEAQHAAAEAKRANQVTEFLVGMFKVADPDVSRGDKLTATQILDRGADQAAQTLGAQPTLQGNLLQVIGEVYTNLGDYPRAEPLLRRAVDLRRDDPTTTPLVRAHALRQLAIVEHKLSKYAAVSDLLAQAEVLLRAETSNEAVTERAGMFDQRGLAQKHLGDLKAALVSHEEGLRLARSIGDDRREATILNHLGLLFYSLDRYAEAEQAYEAALVIDLRIHGEKHEFTLATKENLAETLSALNQHERAITMMRAALATETELLGRDNPERAATLELLGLVYANAQQPTDAIDAFTEALAITEHTLGPESDQAASILGNFGATYSELKQYAKARECLERSVALRRKINGADSYDTAHDEGLLAVTLLRSGRTEEGERLARSALANVERALPSDHRYIDELQSDLGEVLLGAGKYEEARALLQKALSAEEKRGERDSRSAQERRELLAQIPASASK
jgi:tetratricopeptide (TPR) repeat protein/tRNA A-37 threonylcarbamoyl transferase component Bud32